jgi:quinoprotein glucose dehydrogenase
LIRAIDIATGKTVWQDVQAAGGQATPMGYAIQGKDNTLIKLYGE